MLSRIKGAILKIPGLNALLLNSFWYRAARKYLYVFVQHKKQRQWHNTRRLPFYFEHDIDLYSWYWEAAEKGSTFLDRGVVSRLEIFPGARVLDLCCGDGFYPYHFYADIAAHVDAVDLSDEALAYARSNYDLPNIAWHRIDLVTGDLPGSGYDVVIWNAGLDYFDEPQQVRIIRQILESTKPSFTLVGMVPMTTAAEQDDNHACSFESEEQLADRFRPFFRDVRIRTITGRERTSFYFICKNTAATATE